MRPSTVIINATNTVCVTGPSLTAEANATVFWFLPQLLWRLLLNCAVLVYDIVVDFCLLFMFVLIGGRGRLFGV